MWLLPTHKRPELCQRFLDAAIATKVSTPGVVIVNGGEQPQGYSSLSLPPGWSVLYMTEDMKLGPTLNWALQKFPDEPWYGVVCDDQVPKTNEWDKKLLAGLQRYGIVSANDGWQSPQRMQSATVWKGDLIKRLGFLAPPPLKHMYIDDAWEHIGRTLNTWATEMEVLVEHQHHLNGKAPKDESYAESEKLLSEDGQAWAQWRDHELPKLLEQFIPKQLTRQADFTGKSLLFAIPCHGNAITSQTFHGVIDSVNKLRDHNIQFGMLTIPHESLIPKARNSCVEAFKGSTFTHMLFVDADMQFTGDDVLRLLAADQDLVAAVGVRKMEGKTSFCLNGTNIQQDPVTGLIEVDEVGTGFMMISRRCINRMLDAYPKLRYKDRVAGSEHMLLFDTSHDGEYYWSEDYTFCRRWRKIGGKVWVDAMIELGHVGEKTFRGRLIEALMHPEPDKHYDGFQRNQQEPVAEAAE